MTQYIKKSALVAEIERRRRDWRYGSSIEAKYKREECDDILSFLNALEVKEVELKKDFELTWEDVAWIVNETILKCKVESALTAEDICKDVLKLFKAKKGDIV